MTENQPSKSRRGFQRYDRNPSVLSASDNTRSGVRRIVDKSGMKAMIVSQETGEIIAPAGFHEIVEVDKTAFVKIYVNGVKAITGLSKPGARIFEIIFDMVQKKPGTDRLYLSHAYVQAEFDSSISAATFHRGMTELLEKGIIFESTAQGLYWLNIDFLFNGNRLAFIKEFVKVDKAQRQLESSES